MLERFLRLISAVVVGTIISLSVLAQSYPIKLNPHEKAGQTYHLVATTIDSTTAEATASGQLIKKAEESFTAELSANVTIEEASSSGWATRKRFTVLTSKITRGSSTGPILPSGTEVIASIQNGQTVYEVNQKLVDEGVAGALRSVIGLHLASVTDDDMYGTPTPKKIGESWPVSVDAMKKLLKEIGAQGGTQQITGTGTLEKVENNHAFVRSSVNVRDVLLPIRPELTTESGEIETELWGRFPLLVNDITEESNGTIRVSRFASGVDAEGKKALLHVLYVRTDRYAISPIQK
jgi:hypothetical protein